MMVIGIMVPHTHGLQVRALFIGMVLDTDQAIIEAIAIIVPIAPATTGAIFARNHETCATFETANARKRSPRGVIEKFAAKPGDRQKAVIDDYHGDRSQPTVIINLR